jgi:tRNA modification GTPase
MSRRVYHGHVLDPATGESLDEVLLTVFVAPHSYTGEDAAELSCHGSPLVLRRVLDAVISAGARHAQPGEFTLRAYLNSRMDLAQAEAVADLITAKSDAAARAALRQHEGGLSAVIAGLRSALLDATTLVEADIELDDEDDVDSAGVRAALERAAHGISALLRTARLGRVIREGFRVAIVGRPNTGKSTLLNALAGRSRALVLPTPGTTRDVVEETVDLRGLAVTFLDTAGIRPARTQAEKAGVALAMDTASRADAVLVILDASRGWCPSDALAIDAAGSRCAAILWNKADLPNPSRLRGLLEHPITASQRCPTHLISAKTGEGIAVLEDTVHAAAVGDRERAEDVVVTSGRHAQALASAHGLVARALAGLGQGLELVQVAFELREASDALASITGETSSAEIVRSVFARFCVGK